MDSGKIEGVENNVMLKKMKIMGKKKKKKKKFNPGSVFTGLRREREKLQGLRTGGR